MLIIMIFNSLLFLNLIEIFNYYIINVTVPNNNPDVSLKN